MQVPTNLEDMFSYSIWPIIILLFFIITLVYFLLRKKRENLEIFVLTPDDLNIVKKKYLCEITNLKNEYNSKNLSSRKTFQKLSSIIRNFVHDVTGIKVQNYTLEEINRINLPILQELVKEYYNPEFARYSRGDILSSLGKTEEVIKKWK